MIDKALYWREWRRKKGEVYKLNERKRYRKNTEKILKQKKEYYQKNKDSIIKSVRERQDRIKLNMIHDAFERVMDKSDKLPKEKRIYSNAVPEPIPPVGYCGYYGTYHERRAQWRKESGYYRTEKQRAYYRQQSKKYYHRKKHNIEYTVQNS